MFLYYPIHNSPFQAQAFAPVPQGPLDRISRPRRFFSLSFFFFLREFTRVFSSYRTVGNDLAGLGGRGPCGGGASKAPPR